MKSVFISDLHLSAERPDVFNAFSQFIKNLPEGTDELYILGDLFEVWIGDDEPSEFSKKVQEQLAQVSERGIKLVVQHGNRDFAIGRRFCERTGAMLLPDYWIFERNNLKAVLAHGDSLCTDDEDYQKFRKWIRQPLRMWVFSHMPISIRQRIARNIRSKSQERNQNKPENIMDVNAAAVENCLNDHDVDILIHGHTHRPAVHELDNNRQRIVLGDWDKDIWWIETTRAGFELCSKPLLPTNNTN